MKEYQAQPPVEVSPKKTKKVFRASLYLLLVLLLLGAATYSVYAWQQQKIVNLEDRIATSKEKAVVSTLEEAGNHGSINEVSYLEIPEMGVKIKLSENIKDAYYQIENDSMISLKTHSLDVEKGCKERSLSVVGLIKVNKEMIDPSTEKKFSDDGSGVIISDDYYYLRGAQYACAEDKSNLELLSRVRQAFVSASKSIEKL